MEKNNLELTFCGGVGMVTGANFLLENKKNKFKILIDCGLIQGGRENEKKNWEDFSYAPSKIDVLIITHAHMDHIGRIPKLIKDGFRGKIYSTSATKELSPIMFDDAYRLMTYESKKTGIEPFYSKEDIEKAMSLWEGIDYHKEVEVGKDFSIYLKDAGHILGSAIVEVKYKDPSTSSGQVKVAFTGDLGNTPEPLLRNTEFVEDADYVVMESVYGDRNHEEVKDRPKVFEEIVREATEKGGALIIPAFSLERTQVILYELNNLVENKKIKDIPVFVDSPLAIKATRVFEKHKDLFNEKAKKQIELGDDIFDFKNLEFVEKRIDSLKIKSIKGPKIIIAGSGMSEGGRIIFHEKDFLEDDKNTILFVGYQPPGTLGRRIMDGNKNVNILGANVKIRASVKKLLSFSSHKDSDNLLDFVSHFGEKTKKVFVVMGEPKAGMFLAQRIQDNFEIDAIYPEANSTHKIN